MFRDKIVDRISSQPDLIETVRSRCSRSRFYGNKCSRCADCCTAGAISLDGGVYLDQRACTECLLCAAACPCGGIKVNSLNFYSVVSRLRNVPKPVLSCDIVKGLNAHVKTLCLGFLSKEHIMALIVFVESPLQLNLTGCSTCKNGFVTDFLKKRLGSLGVMTSLDAFEKIRLIEDKAALEYEDIPCNRRSFFGEMKKMTLESAAGFLNSVKTPEENTHGYSEKMLPFRMELLNKVFTVVPEQTRKELAANCYYGLSVSKQCDMCLSCTASCPTGALRDTRDSADSEEDGQREPELLFDASLCSGCGLCSDFCINGAISIEEGFSGDSPFESVCLKKGHFQGI